MVVAHWSRHRRPIRETPLLPRGPAAFACHFRPSRRRAVHPERRRPRRFRRQYPHRREQRYGYWETVLTSRFPNKNVTFRNLGWSGDTVWGEARAGFGKQADGFNHLKEHVLRSSRRSSSSLTAQRSVRRPRRSAKFEKGLNTRWTVSLPRRLGSCCWVRRHRKTGPAAARSRRAEQNYALQRRDQASGEESASCCSSICTILWRGGEDAGRPSDGG